MESNSPEPNCLRTICDIEVLPSSNDDICRLLSVRVGLQPGILFDGSIYFDNDEMPNEKGIKVMTAAFIQGLIANIRVAHQNNFWSEADHMRHIVTELNKGFVDSTDFKISKL